jgi:hypothetical protein
MKTTNMNSHTNDSRGTLVRLDYVIVRGLDGTLWTTDARHAARLLPGEQRVQFDELTNAERHTLHEILFPVA